MILIRSFFSHTVGRVRPRPFECNECSKTFLTSSNLKNHRKTHLPPEFKCDLCLKMFTFKQARDKHMNLHTTGTESNRRPYSYSRSSADKEKKKFKCDFCDYSCDFRYYMSGHMNSHTGERPFQCDECSKTFSSSNSLKTHRKVHLAPEFKCDFCPKMFTYKQRRDDHMNTHTGAKPFKCKICKKGFNSLSRLGQHRKRHPNPAVPERRV